MPIRPLASTLFAALLGAAVLAGSADPAAAHPAPFPHRHAIRRPPPEPLSHQRRPRRDVEPTRTFPRLHLSIGPLWNGVSSPDDDGLSAIIDDGAGFEVEVGVRFSPYAGLDFALMQTFHDAGPAATSFDSAAMTALTANLRAYLLGRPTRLEPYALLGFGGYVLNRDAFSDTLSGPGFQLGGGLDVHLNPVVSLAAQLLYRGAWMDNSEAQFSGSPAESRVFNLFTFTTHLRFDF